MLFNVYLPPRNDRSHLNLEYCVRPAFRHILTGILLVVLVPLTYEGKSEQWPRMMYIFRDEILKILLDCVHVLSEETPMWIEELVDHVCPG